MERHNEQVFYKKAALKNFAIFAEQQLRLSLFLNKNTSLQSWNFIKKRLQHRFCPVNIAKLVRAPVLKNICQRLFERFPTSANNITSYMGTKEDIFLKPKQKKPFKIQLDGKNFLFHDALQWRTWLWVKGVRNFWKNA